MRRISYLGFVCLLAGCRSQALPVTNPFVAPAMVPPPATRTPAPGTAAPYYPGDPLPGSTPGAAPAPITPPASNAPGGWNTYPPTGQVPSFNSGVQQASANINLGPSETVQIPNDNEALRFSQLQPSPTTPQGFSAPTTPTNPPTTNVMPPQQDVAPVQFIQQQTPAPLEEQRSVVIREVTSQQAEQRASGGPSAGRDGFRPQGSSRTAREQQRVSRPTEPAIQEPRLELVDRFGFDPSYTSLRGQLQQSPTTGQWQLRYLPQQAARDQFGGTMAIANPQVLGNLHSGDFVAVQGNVQLVQLDSQSSVPTFAVSVLQRQQQDMR